MSLGWKGWFIEGREREREEREAALARIFHLVCCECWCKVRYLAMGVEQYLLSLPRVGWYGDDRWVGLVYDVPRETT